MTSAACPGDGKSCVFERPSVLIVALVGPMHAINVRVRLARPMLCLYGIVYGPLWGLSAVNVGTVASLV